jgi:choline transport protein
LKVLTNPFPGDPWEKGGLRTIEPSVLGLAEKAERNIGPLDIVCIGWNICISWAGVSGTLALTIYQGGPVTLIYGIIICFVMVGCSGLTLAELASVYPTAGGRYVITQMTLD